MAYNPHSILSKIIEFFLLTFFLCIIQNQINAISPSLIRNNSDALRDGSTDYGNIVQEIPNAVLYPSNTSDIIDLIKSSNNGPKPFTIAAKGRGHSVRGQAMARGGVVVNMATLRETQGNIGIKVYGNSSSSTGCYADVGGEQLWIDVLKTTMKYGLAPVSWTDYLYLSVGGTLSNAGISGHSFKHGPQINNVLELDVITGKGDFVTCSRNTNPELFFAVLGGLGQFGIITRARIILDKAPTRVKWYRLVYNNFTDFSRDQEFLISNSSSDYVGGVLVTNDHNTIKKGLLYCIDLAKYYDNKTAKTIDKEIKKLLKQLHFIPNYGFDTDVTLVYFLDRIAILDNPDQEPSRSHPWLNLFIPKSRIMDFNAGVFVNMLSRLNETLGHFIFYPIHKNKWDDRMSAVTPDENIFYILGLQHSSLPSESDTYDKFNNQVLSFCKKAGIKVKQYLPYYKSKEEWRKHFGSKWSIFQKRKLQFDPKMILSPGQRIFNSLRTLM